MGKKRKKGKARRQAGAQDFGSLRESTRAYEAAMSIPSRGAVIGADQSPDAAVDQGLSRIRDWGRYLDENDDLSVGVLDELVKNIVGSGIITIPKPLRADGSIDEALGAEITELWKRWTRRADVTGELSWHDAQRLICRAWMRDGEQFLQHVAGRNRGYPFGLSDVPYRVELLESDMVPWDLTDDTWRQGVRLNTWRMPIEYAVYLRHPGDSLRGGAGIVTGFDETSMKTVAAGQITHVKNVRRWPSTRGMSAFAAVIARLYDIKDLEDSERVKNRILASYALAITRSPDTPGMDNSGTDGRRFTGIARGTLIDDLAPGESVEGIGADYPMANMPAHIADQIRRIASGTGTRYSSIARQYNGTYAAQRQELVESEGHYRIREDAFVSKVCRVVYERWLLAAMVDGVIAAPASMDFGLVSNAEFRGPITPWIDPLKEVQADALAVKENFVTREQVQIKRGASPEIIGKDPEPAPNAAPAQLSLIADDEPEEPEEDAA